MPIILFKADFGRRLTGTASKVAFGLDRVTRPGGLRDTVLCFDPTSREIFGDFCLSRNRNSRVAGDARE